MRPIAVGFAAASGINLAAYIWGSHHLINLIAGCLCLCTAALEQWLGT